MTWFDSAAFAAAQTDWPFAAFVAVTMWLVTHHIAFRRLRLLHQPQGQARKVTAAEVRQMFASQSGCSNNPYCRADFRATRFEVDHIVAKSRGGPDGVANAQLLCRDCNQMKGAQPWSMFLAQYQEQRMRRMQSRDETRDGVTYRPR